MSEERDLPVDEPLPAPGTQPGRRERVSSAGSRLWRLMSRLPGARPRPQFDFPPEDQAPEILPEPVVDPDAKLADERRRFGGAPPPLSAGAGPDKHPIRFGFMFTVGVGFALLLFFIITNVGELLVWIGAALFIALGLDPVVRWLSARGVPRPAGIAIVVVVLAGAVTAFFATLIPTIVSQTTEIVNNAPSYVDRFLSS
ncbi:MAG: AI-2E family transporter, partial [Arthrobacter sp.]